MENELNIYNI